MQVSPWELSFISVGGPRLGTQPWVCDACFTFPCLLVCNIHKSITLDQSSHIVTLAEFCRFKYFAILLKNWDIALAEFCRSKYFPILLKNFAWVTFYCHTEGGGGYRTLLILKDSLREALKKITTFLWHICHKIITMSQNPFLAI